MDIGKLRHRVELQHDTGTAQDAYGAPTADWQTYGLRWAEVVPVSGREAEYAKSYAATVDHKITLRYCVDLKPQHRIKFGARLFYPNAILDRDGRKRELTVFATEQVT
jgi:SPP1 family predicted phage head-tail adaptor